MAGERTKSINVPLPIVEPATNPSLQPSPQIAPTTSPRMRVVAPSASAVAVNPMSAAPAAPVVGPDNRIPMPSSAEIAAAAAKAYQPTDNKLAAFAQGFANAQALQNKSQREVDAENRKLEEAERLKAKQIDFLRNTDPEMAAAVEAGVLDPQTAYTTSRSATAGKYKIQKMDNGDLIRIDENTGKYEVLGSFGEPDEFSQRKQRAQELGIPEDDPRYDSYVLTGKMPREDAQALTATDKKAILEADELVQANSSAIDVLKSVIQPDDTGKSLNDKVGYGATAGAQAWGARNDPTGGYLFDQDKGAATTELDNKVLGQALGQLKATFGAAPTEGERKILVDLQASIDKTPQERKIIIDNAIKLAENRLRFNQERADGLRGGTFYKPKNAQQGASGYRDPMVKQSDAATKAVTDMSDDELERIANGG